MRDRWLRAVLRADSDDLSNAVKLVCVALSFWMDDNGRVTANRQDVADAVGWETKQRVSDRLREARNAGFLDVVTGGKNGRPVTYDAMIPAKYRPGTPPQGTPGNGSRGTSNGGPAHAQEIDARYPATGHQYARASTDVPLEAATSVAPAPRATPGLALDEQSMGDPRCSSSDSAPCAAADGIPELRHVLAALATDEDPTPLPIGSTPTRSENARS